MLLNASPGTRGMEYHTCIGETILPVPEGGSFMPLSASLGTRWVVYPYLCGSTPLPAAQVLQEVGYHTCAAYRLSRYQRG